MVVAQKYYSSLKKGAEFVVKFGFVQSLEKYLFETVLIVFILN